MAELPSILPKTFLGALLYIYLYIMLLVDSKSLVICDEPAGPSSFVPVLLIVSASHNLRRKGFENKAG